MTIYIKTKSPAAVGIIYRRTAPDAFEVIAYREAFRSDHGFDGALLSKGLAGKMIEMSAPFAVSLADLQARADWHDYSSWAVPLVFDQGIGFRPPFNLYAETAASKVMFGDLARRNGENYAVLLFVPTRKTDSLDETALTLYVDRTGTLPAITDSWPVYDADKDTLTVETVTPDQPITLVDPANDVMVQDAVFPVLKLNGPPALSPDAWGDFTIQAVNQSGTAIALDDFEINLEATGGYLPLRRLVLKDGKATFRVSGLGLQSGDAFKIKAGSRLFSSIASLVVSVP